MKMNRTNNSELYERVTAAGKFFGGLPAFAEMIGVQYRTFHAYLSAKRQHNLWPLLPTMLEAFPRLSRQWLYFGEGPMLIGHGTPLDRPVPLQEIAAAAEAMAAEAGGTWGDVLTYIVDAARAEGEKREPVADSRQIQELQEKLLAAQAKIIQLQDELLTRQKEGHAGAPKAAPARIGASAARLQGGGSRRGGKWRLSFVRNASGRSAARQEPVPAVAIISPHPGAVSGRSCSGFCSFCSMSSCCCTLFST